MNDNAYQVYVYGYDPLRAEYEQESRVLGWMKKSFVVTSVALVVTFVAMILIGIPDFEAKYGAVNLAELVAYAPAIMSGFFPVILWLGCAPSGYIWAVRAIRRSHLFVMGSLTGFAVLLILFIGIPVLVAPVAFIVQWGKVARLKSRLG